jgi:hypothetical protein
MCSPMPDGDDFGPVTVPDNWGELQAAEDEMGRQDELWGQQDHPDIGGKVHARSRRASYLETLDRTRDREAFSRKVGYLGWDDILLEEVYEALSEGDEEKMRVELIQVAAVALQWAGAIRRRQKNG